MPFLTFAIALPLLVWGAISVMRGSLFLLVALFLVSTCVFPAEFAAVDVAGLTMDPRSPVPVGDCRAGGVALAARGVTAETFGSARRSHGAVPAVVDRADDHSTVGCDASRPTRRH